MIKIKSRELDYNLLVVPRTKTYMYKLALASSYDGTHSIQLPLDKTGDYDWRLVKIEIEKFIKYAKERPTWTFVVTGFTPKADFESMFYDVPSNVTVIL